MKPVSSRYTLFVGIWLSMIVVFGMLLPIPNIPILKETARNIYFHVPQSFAMIFILTISFWNSFQYLRKKDLSYDRKAESAASVGMLFGFTTIVTGAVWADFTWGVFWNWDPKQTLFLGLLFIYGAYFILRMSVDDETKKASLSAAYNLFSFVLMPFLVFVLPRMLPGLHPGSPEEGGANNPVFTGINLMIRIMLYSSVIGFCMLSYWLYNIRYRITTLKSKMD
ncbi:MAG: cytochrome c biogenesis protein [Bacteroidetes bacterium]|nr:cytochrome c biogenesis protein [Bacteroidota bacterium]